jgi:hypothetical protein
MATKIYDLAVKIGKYVGSDGKEKGRWQNVGAIMQTDDGGKFIMMAKWFNPAGVPDLAGKGGDSILLSMFPPKDYGDEVPTRQVEQEKPGFVVVPPKQASTPAIARAARPAPVAPITSEDMPF